MQVFGLRDFILYFVITFYFIGRDFGLTTLLLFLIENAYFTFIKLPYIFIARRKLLPFPYHSSFSQRATDFEFIVTELMKHYYEFIQQSDIGRVFFDGRTFEFLNKIRRLRECSDGLGDTIVSNSLGVKTEKYDDMKGSWIYSKSRVDVKECDIVIFYIHGGTGFGLGSGHMYTEYLSILLVNLMEQGFSNPIIFVPQFERSTYEKYPTQVIQLLKVYEMLNSVFTPECKLVIMSDSTGCTLSISLLMQLSQPSNLLLTALKDENLGNDFKDNQVLGEYYKGLRKPSALIFISPVINLAGVFNLTTKCKSDYITKATIQFWVNKFISKELLAQTTDELHYFDPGQIRDISVLKQSFPIDGVVVSYGTDELIREDTENFIGQLKRGGIKVKVDKQVAQVHNWSILNFYTERLIDHREASLQTFSGILSRMLLWKTSSYFQEGSKEPTSIVTIDEDHT